MTLSDRISKAYENALTHGYTPTTLKLTLLDYKQLVDESCLAMQYIVNPPDKFMSYMGMKVETDRSVSKTYIECGSEHVEEVE